MHPSLFRSQVLGVCTASLPLSPPVGLGSAEPHFCGTPAATAQGHTGTQATSWESYRVENRGVRYDHHKSAAHMRVIQHGRQLVAAIGETSFIIPLVHQSLPRMVQPRIKCNHDSERPFAFNPHIVHLDSPAGRPEHRSY